MRNVLVVLVLSCIGLSCGFIVPSGIREIIADLNKNANSIQKSIIKPRNMIKSRTLNINSVTPTIISELITKSIEIHNNSSNNSLADDLYENSKGKDATIEERSFIYIKPRARTPYLKNVFESISKANFENKRIKSYVLTHRIFDDISRRVITEDLGNKFFNTRVGQKNHDQYESKINNFINYYIDTQRRQKIKKVSHHQGKHFEAIKAPLPRPIVKTKEKDLISMENSLFNFTIGRKLLDDIQESISNKSAIIIINDGQLENKSTEGNYALGVTVSDKIFIDDNLDQTIKKVIGNPILGRKSNDVVHHGFYFCWDCLKKLNKKPLSSRLLFESICKCGRKRLRTIVGDDIVN